MSDEVILPPVVHHHAAQVLISSPYQVVEDDSMPNVITVVRQVRIITVNGEIWAKQVLAYGGVPIDADVVKDWDATYKTDWTKVNS